MRAAGRAGAIEASAGIGDLTTSAAGPSLASAPSVSEKETLSELCGLQVLWVAFVARITAGVQEVNEHQADPTKSTATMELLMKDSDELRRRVANVQQCHLTDKDVSTSLDRYRYFANDTERDHWTMVTSKLALESTQVNSLKALRSSLLTMLETILLERVSLCNELSELLNKAHEAAHNRQLFEDGQDRIGEWSSNMSRAGVACFENIKTNAQREYQALVEFNMIVVHTVLVPSQVVRFMVESHPLHAHALYIAHVLNLQHHVEAVGPGAGGGVDGVGGAGGSAVLSLSDL